MSNNTNPNRRKYKNFKEENDIFALSVVKISFHANKDVKL